MDTTVVGRIYALRDQMIMPFSLASLALLGLPAVINLVDSGVTIPVLFEIAVIFSIVANLFTYLSTSKGLIARFVFVTLLITVSLLTLFSGTASIVGAGWHVLIPVVVILLLDTKAAIGVTVFQSLSLLVLPLIFKDNLGGVSQSDVFILVPAIAVSAAFSVFVKKKLSDLLLLQAEEKQTEIHSEQSLKEEIARREQVEAKMTEVLKKLEENNQQLERATAIDEATISSIGEAVVIVNPDGIIVRANPSAGRVLGVNQEDLLNTQITDRLSFSIPSDESKHLEREELVIAESMKHRSISDEVYKIVRPDEAKLYAQMTASPLVVGGVVYGAVVVVRDVTHEVVVDQAKSEFVSIASHQLRTPLSTINWYLEMVLAGDFGPINDEQREFIQEAYGASKRMGGLINALLNASRIDVGLVGIEPEDNVDIRKVLSAVLIDLESKITDKGANVDVRIDETVKPMTLDPRIMNIIFLNLISNAVKYSPRDSQVTVSATNDGTHLIISVADKGYGIPAASQGKIFTKMFRAENAVEQEPDGNGLGLYIIKSILETMGGEISFVSDENKGTTFTARIPGEGMEKREGTKQLTLKADG